MARESASCGFEARIGRAGGKHGGGYHEMTSMSWGLGYWHIPGIGHAPECNV